MTQTNDILQALDAFIRKYYKNLLLKGVLYAVGIILTLFLAAVLMEHFGWLSTLWRGLIFWGGLTATVLVLAWYVVRPLLKMQGLGKRISHQEAAVIVGRHFPEVSDKLLNLLQLMESTDTESSSLEESAGTALTPPNQELLLAAIEQKSAQLRPVPMLNAINLKGNRKYLKYALPPLLVLLVLLLAAPRVVTEPSHRIVNYSTHFERPAPFAFELLNPSLAVLPGQDFLLSVGVDGEALPAEVFITVEGNRHRMSRVAPNRFEYSFRKVNRSQHFVLEGAGVTSETYQLLMLPDPRVVSFRMHLAYPAYTGRRAETVVDLGDAAVPEGTVVRWIFQTRDADSLTFFVDSTGHRFEAAASGSVDVQRRVMQSLSYGFSVSNSQVVGADTLRYHLAAIADAAPQISVDELIDSVYPDRHIFRGRIKDDYGFSKLLFRHEVDNSTDTTRNAVSEAEIALTDSSTSQEFFFVFNTAEIILAPGDHLTYYFEVSDNDAIHGPKSTRSQRFEIKIPSQEQLDSLLSQSSSDIRQSASTQMSELRQMQQQIDDALRRLVDKKELNWQDQKELRQLADEQRKVLQMMQQMRQQIQENNRLEQRYREQSEQLMEKQRELDRLMNEVMDEKMKETMAEIERLMQSLDKQKVQQELQQLKLDNSELEKQLDQNIELMKRLEVEKKVEQTIQKMDRLAEEQRELSRQTEQAKGKDNADLQQQQQQLNDRFRQLEKDLEQIRKDYRELDPSTDFRVPDSLGRQVEQQQQQSQQQLDRGKRKEASQHQKEAAEGMERLSEAVAQAQLDAEQEDLAEDAEQVRQLLKNLVRLSFNQEELISDLNATYIHDPRYQSIITRQNRVKDDFRNVEDSLRAMARRQVQVASAITKEVGEVNSNISRSLGGLLDMNQSFYGNYKNTNASRSMQYSMTSLNNLALVLAESLDQMQNQMRQNSQRKKNGQCKNRGKSNSQCSNPGSKPSPKSMRQMQQELNKQMEALKKQLDKQGKQQGGRHQLGQGQQMSEEFARMAAQQEMIRRMMQEYGSELKSAAGGDPKLAREIEQMMRQMEQTETDLVNRTITRQTLQRQQQIMTRLLEHEKADLEREKEQRRESHEAGDLYSQPSPDELERYNRQLSPTPDQLRSTPPSLTPYYRSKVDNYFYR